jgi:hypothetical protein
MKTFLRFLLLFLFLAAIGLVASRFLAREPEPTLSALFETAGGLTVGQTVALSGEENGGTIRSIEPSAGGVIVTVALRQAQRLGKGTVLLMRPAPPPVPPRLEIIPANEEELLSSTARVPGRIEIGPPDGLAEPSPIWPGTES